MHRLPLVRAADRGFPHIGGGSPLRHLLLAASEGAAAARIDAGQRFACPPSRIDPLACGALAGRADPEPAIAAPPEQPGPTPQPSSRQEKAAEAPRLIPGAIHPVQASPSHRTPARRQGSAPPESPLCTARAPLRAP